MVHKIYRGDLQLKVEEINIGGTKIKFFDDFITDTKGYNSNSKDIILNTIRIIIQQDNL